MTLDEARLMANVNSRSQRLFEDGYRARWNGNARLEIRSAKGAVYLVDTEAETCDCPFYRAHQGRHPCKHSLGWHRLLLILMLKAWADLDDRMPAGILEAARHD